MRRRLGAIDNADDMTIFEWNAATCLGSAKPRPFCLLLSFSYSPLLSLSFSFSLSLSTRYRISILFKFPYQRVFRVHDDRVSGLENNFELTQRLNVNDIFTGKNLFDQNLKGDLISVEENGGDTQECRSF